MPSPKPPKPASEIDDAVTSTCPIEYEVTKLDAVTVIVETLEQWPHEIQDVIVESALRLVRKG